MTSTAKEGIIIIFFLQESRVLQSWVLGILETWNSDAAFAEGEGRGRGGGGLDRRSNNGGKGKVDGPENHVFPPSSCSHAMCFPVGHDVRRQPPLARLAGLWRNRSLRARYL